MSNPAVIVLDKVNSIKKIKRFVIEDNIGESLHIHIDNIRIDFTVEEYLDFANTVKDSVEEMNLFCGYNLENFDVSFLKNCGTLLTKLVKISKEKVKLQDLLCVQHKNILGEVIDFGCKINKTKGYQFLKDGNLDFLSYPQQNYWGVDNSSRLNNLLNSLKENGYPYNDNYIILFNGQNIIRDGQHRAIVLAYLYGLDHEIEVLRFYFSDNRHKLNFIRTNFKTGLLYVVKKVYKIVKKVYRILMK